MGHEVFIFAPYMSNYQDKDPEVFRLVAVKVHNNPEIRFGLPFIHSGHIKKLSSFKLDVIHAQTPGTVGLLGKYLAYHHKIPFIYTHHTDYAAHSKNNFNGRKILPAIVNWWIKVFSNMADVVIVPSNKISDVLGSYGVKKTIFLIQTGINLGTFAKTQETIRVADILKNDLGIASSKNIIFVGRMSNEKNIDFLIQAFAKISEHRHDIKLLFVGDGPNLADFKAKVKTLNLKNIIFVGSIPHEKTSTYYQAGNLFVFSSYTDTQGLVLMEAVASGLPVVALKDGAFEGIVINDENGYLVEKDSTDEFAKKVLTILDNELLSAKFSANSLRIARNFSEEEQAAKLLEIYRKTISKI